MFLVPYFMRKIINTIVKVKSNIFIQITLRKILFILKILHILKVTVSNDRYI